MKKVFITIIAMLLPMLAMGQILLSEVDFTAATEFTGWYQFDDTQTDGKVELTADGLAITVGIQTGQLWQPQVMVIPDGSFNLKEYGNYRVVVTAKFPTSGTLQMNMGTWSANDQAQFPVEATGDFQTVECDFEGWSVDAEGAHLLLQCGDFKGTTILKSIKVVEIGEGGEPVAEDELIYENDFTGITAFDGWSQFGDEQTDGKVDVDADGVAITVGIQTGQFWQPQVMIVPDGSFNLAEDGDYIVVVTAKFPADGTLQINMGTWSANDQAQFPVTATGDFQQVVCEFPSWSVDAEGAHLLLQCGDFKGTTIIKKIQVFKLESRLNYKYNTVDKTAEVIPHAEGKYYGIVVIPSKVIYAGKEYSVTGIGSSAFEGCTGMTSIIIQSSVTTIGDAAFYGCTGLTIVDIPNGVKTIGEGAFSKCEGLTSVTIPGSVTSIGKNAFFQCYGLTQITSGIENPFAISDDVFYCTDKNIYATATLIVPPGKKSAYQSTAGWNKFQNIVEAGAGGKEFEANGVRYLIGENNTVSVTSKTEKYTGDVSIPNQVTYNGDNYIVTSIGLSAFEGCEDMTSVSIPGSVTSICNGAFWECSSLKTVVIPDGVSTIGEGAFRNCYSLISVDIPNSVTSIGSSAFGNCENLTQITSGIENPFAIDDYVFLCDDKDLYATATLIVPAGKKSAYQNTAGWKKFQNIYYADGVYTLTYYVDEEEYKSVTYSSGAGITPEPAPTKEGYTFSGWSEIPESMPDYDVTVTGTFTVNKYDLTYKIDGEVYVTYQIEYGTPITPEAEPTKEGYTFSGWSYIPETMPAVEVNVVGSFTVNQYTITYVIDGEEYATVTVDFNSKIVPLTPPSKDGFDFAWEEYPETMPAHDITINGAYTTTGILSIAIESGKAKIFTLDGRQVDTPQKGINIIRMDEGTIKKVVLGK